MPNTLTKRHRQLMKRSRSVTAPGEGGAAADLHQTGIDTDVSGFRPDQLDVERVDPAAESVS